jgi:hypothetical protein
LIGKLPAFQFYPGDWKKDPGVQALNLHERGLWFEMLLLMHDSEERGKLVLNGRAMPHSAIAQALGLDNQIFEKGLTLLLEFGVASIDRETGVIFCRRMVKDEKVRKTHAEAGKRGGNPNLVNQKSTPRVNQTSNQKPTPSSSSSSSTTDIKNRVDRARATEPEPTPEPPKPQAPPAPEPEAILSMVRRIVCAHPKSQLRKLREREVTQAQEAAVLAAMADEISLGETEMGALAMILALTETLAYKVPRSEWRFFKDAVGFYRDHDYRLEPGHWAREGSNGRSNSHNRGAAVGRVDRGLESLRKAAEESGDYAVRDDDGGDDCVLPASGDSRVNAKTVSGGVSSNGSGARHNAAEGSIAGHSPPTGPEVLPPSQRGGRGS